jgi:hypothetical protein
MRFEDFLVTSDHEGTAGGQGITPLQGADLQTGDRLLMVTCEYQLAEQESVEVEDLFCDGARLRELPSDFYR